MESQSLEIVQCLLESGALVDAMGEDYTTPLHKAAILNNKTIIELLLKYGASKDVCDYFGKKPIDYVDDHDMRKVFDTDFNIVNRVQELFCCKKIVAYCYHIENEFKEKLMGLKKVKIENEFDPKKVTHFYIRKTHKASVRIFSAMLNGCSIVPQESIDDFLKDQYFIDIPNYTFISKFELNIGIQKAMVNSLLKLPQLFDGVCFYIHGHRSFVPVYRMKITKADLIKLITEGGGKILPRAPTPRTCEVFKHFPYHSNKEQQSSRCCHFIIYEEKYPPAPLYQMADLKHKSSKWLIDCITKFNIIL